MLAIAAPDGKGYAVGAGGVRYSVSTVLVAIAIHISTLLDAGISTPLDAGISAPVSAGVSAPVSAGVSAPVSAGISAPVSAGISAPVAERSRSDRVVSPTAALGGTGMGSRPSLGSV